MGPTAPVWRVLQQQQELARTNARQALLTIRQRRQEQEGYEVVVPLDHGQRTRSTRRSSQTGSGDS